jgi:hypothetical protein
VSFVSAVIFFSSVIFSPDMVKHVLNPKLEKLETQARASEQELKSLRKSRKWWKWRIKCCRYGLYLYAQCIATWWALSIIDYCYYSKEKVFFGTFGLRPSSMSQSEFVILTN